MKYLTLLFLTMLIGCQTIETLPLDTLSTKPVIETHQKAAKKIPVPPPHLITQIFYKLKNLYYVVL